ncbi:MAG: sigma-54-dependent transcriptional regulator [Polyangiales bacterium]
MKARILVVDDDQSQCDVFEATLTRLEYECDTTTSPRQALELLSTKLYDVVLTDLGMSEMDGLALCERIFGMRPDVPVIVVTGQSSLAIAVAAMRAGAYDFLTKPVDGRILQLSVERATQHHRLDTELKHLREVVVDNTGGPFLGDSAAAKRVVDLIARVAPSDASVLIQGETGTGKELVARSLHDHSAQKKGPFVAINCAAVPANLLESELFGHAKGAFTDAKAPRQGLFVEASGGTLFLDEIGDMPLEMQAKLLRVLQERKVRPVGSNVEIPFDTRIIAATHRDLEADVESRRFRQDLFYRINVVRIDVPSLRERESDVLKLTDHFLAKAAARRGGAKLSLSPQAAERLLAYDWPGNIRELENCIERAITLARFNSVTLEDLPDKIRAYRADRFVVSADEPGEIVTLDELERRYVLRAIKLLGGNKARAAKSLGVDRRTLYRKLEKYSEDSKTAPVDGRLRESL